MSDFNIGPAVRAARAAASEHRLTLGVGHAQEILASQFGFNTYNGMIVELAQTREGTGLLSAEHYILNSDWGLQRCRALRLPRELAACCLVGAQEAFGNLFTNVDDFWHAVARDEVIRQVNDDEHFSAAMAALAHVEYDPEGFELDRQSKNFWQARTRWVLHTSGEMQGAFSDEDGEDFLEEETIDVWGRVTYQKAGRAGLVLSNVEVSPVPDRFSNPCAGSFAHANH